MVRSIVEAVCDVQTEGSIDADEQNTIAAEVADWVLNSTVNETPPTSEEAARHAIGVIATQIFLTEAIEMIDAQDSRIDRQRFVERVRETAAVLAQRADIVDSGKTPNQLAQSIKTAIEGLRKIHGKKS